jgi:hypothetical protein
MNIARFFLHSTLLAGVVLVGAASPTAAQTVAQFDEVPSGVAVSNNGLSGVGLENSRGAVVVTQNNSRLAFNLGCAVSGVESDPSGTWAWTICRDNSYIGVVALATGQTSIADIGVTNAFRIEYSPTNPMIVILGAAGDLTTVSATSINDYGVMKRIAIGETASALAVSPNGRTAYVATDSGKLATVDLRSGSLRKFMVPSTRGTTMYVSGVTTDPRGRNLFLVGIEVDQKTKKVNHVVLSMSASTRQVTSRQVLAVTVADATPMAVEMGRNTVYVGAGSPIKLSTGQTGLVQLAVSPRGVLGTPKPVLATPVIVGSLDLSADGKILAVATTNGELIRVATNT